LEILLSGKPASEKVLSSIEQKLKELQHTGSAVPHLAVIQVGDDPASTIYVKNKIKTSKKLGMRATLHKLPQTASQSDLLSLVQDLNENKDIHGILVQLPLPYHIDADEVLRALNPSKDVDCLHPENVGALWLGKPFVKPCTPAGIIELLKFYDITLEGKRAVIVGRSNIVGKPLCALMLQENATVTLCHSRTKELARVCQEAEILVVAIGKARFITSEFVQEGAVVIDVGVNRVKNETGDEIIVGDVDFEQVKQKVHSISPVPGGVGPMTIAMLMRNLFTCYEAQEK